MRRDGAIGVALARYAYSMKWFATRGLPIALILIYGADFPSVVSYERLRFLVAVAALLNTVCAFRSRSEPRSRIIPPEISPLERKAEISLAISR